MTIHLDPVIYDVADRGSALVCAALLKGPLSAREIADVTGVDETKVRRTLVRLDGHVEPVQGRDDRRRSRPPVGARRYELVHTETRALVEKAYRGRWKRFVPMRLRHWWWKFA